MSLLKSSAIVSGATLVSRVFGFLRDMVIANKLGASNASDAFFVAMIVPNLLRRIFAEGAFNVVFVPILGRIKNEQGQQAAERFVSVVMMGLFVTLLALTLLAEWAMPWIIQALAGGWDVTSERGELAVLLSRITFPYLMMITFASLFGGISNTYGRFVWFALTPVILNIVLIAGFLYAPDDVNTAAIYGAWAMTVGGVLQMLFMLWRMTRIQFKIRLSSNFKHEEVKPLLLRLGPAALTVGLIQVSFLVDTFLASFLESNAVSYLQYANRFYQQPLSLIGIALATVLLPHLSSALKEHDKTRANKSFEEALLYGFALALASAVGLIALAQPLISVLFGHGAFTPEDVKNVAEAMQAYCLAIPAMVITKVTITCFYANEDTKTPAQVSLICLVVNIGMTLLLMQMYGFVGIALSTAVTGWVNAAIQLFIIRRRKFVYVNDSETFRIRFGKALLTNAIMAIIVGCMVIFMPQEASRTVHFAWICGVSAVGGAVFGALGHALGLFNIRRIFALMRR